MKKRLLSAAAALIAMLQLISCKGPQNDVVVTSMPDVQTTAVPEEPDDPEMPEEKEYIYSLVTDGRTVFSVVRPDSCGRAVIDAAVELNNAISDMTGKNNSIKNDWVKKESEIDNISAEILVGITNREASRKISGQLKADDYKIAVDGSKIIICGGSEKATVEAVGYFIENCLKNGNIRIKGEIFHKGEYVCDNFSIGGIPVKNFDIIYSSSAPRECGRDVAEELAAVLSEYTGAVLETHTDVTNSSGNEIIIGQTKRKADIPFYKSNGNAYIYCVEASDGNLYICGWSFLGLKYCVKHITENYLKTGRDIPENKPDGGDMYGECLYELSKNSDLRIMSNNLWNCDSNKEAWIAKGEDCSAKNRVVGLSAIYMAYEPDILCLQELSPLMTVLLRSHFGKAGKDYLFVEDPNTRSFTNIMYNNKTVKLLDSGYHLFDYGCDGGSKSYTWGYFERITDGERFIVLSTHMWWKSEVAQKGSNVNREKQAAEIVTAMDILIEKYNCPVFVMGDFNTTTESDAFRVYTDGGYKNAYDLAETFRDNHRGWHPCNPNGFSLENDTGTYKKNAIDHIILKNGGNVKISVFNHVRPHFYINLSDHYPLYIDFKFQ